MKWFERSFLFLLLAVAASRPAGAAEKVDLIIIAAHVLTLDDQGTILEPGALAIRGDTILAVGTPGTIQQQYKARSVYRAGDRWVMPGLINVHTHAAMNLMRGLGDDLELMTWLQKYIFPLEAKVVDARYVYEATLAGCAEMISRGVTTFADMYYFEDEVARAAREVGLRAVLGETVIGFPAPDFKTPAESLTACEKWMRQWAGDPLVAIVPAPHSVYTVTPEDLRRCRDLAAQYNSLLHFHLSESPGEVADVRQKYDKTPVQQAAGLGLLGPRTLAAHCVQLTPDDLKLLAESGAGVAHNPDSNLKLASGLAPVAELRRRGVRVGLGTDGAVSSNRLDLFHAMDLAAKIHKVRENDATVMKAEEVVRMATRAGAAVLGLDAVTGALTPGRKADLIVLDLSSPAYLPVNNIYSQLVYVAHGEAVESTMTGGRWLMKERRLLTIDPARVQKTGRHYQTVFRQALVH